MSDRIITISRQFGSGGRTIGRQLGEKLGLRCYDQEMIERIVEQSGFTEDYIRQHGEYAEHGFFAGLASAGYYGTSNQDLIWTLQCRTIREIAEQGPCIIVGRCADYVLRDEKKLLKVFIHASEDWRAKRIVEVYGERTETPEQRIKEKDKARAAYYRFYTDMKWGASRNYDISLDSETIGLDNCVDILARIYQNMD